MRLFLTLLAALVVLPGCYHTTVLTGRQPSMTVVNKPWAMSFIGGLIPPADLDVSRECPQGVAKVESQMSVPNMLVAVITGGLVTPMTMTVTCASGSASADQPTIEVAQDASTADIQTAFAEAAEQVSETGEPVYVAFK